VEEYDPQGLLNADETVKQQVQRLSKKQGAVKVARLRARDKRARALATLKTTQPGVVTQGGKVIRVEPQR
jgi:hypothetical protein